MTIQNQLKLFLNSYCDLLKKEGCFAALDPYDIFRFNVGNLLLRGVVS